MTPFPTLAIGQKVNHAATAVTGAIVGIYLNRRNQYDVLVEYADKNGLAADRWYPVEELSVHHPVPEKSPQINVTNIASTAKSPKAEKKTAPPASEAESEPQPKAADSPITSAASQTSPQADAAPLISINVLIAAGTKLAKIPATDAADPKTSGKEKLRAIFFKYGKAANVTQVKVTDYAAVLADIQAATPAE